MARKMLDSYLSRREGTEGAVEAGGEAGGGVGEDGEARRSPTLSKNSAGDQARCKLLYSHTICVLIWLQIGVYMHFA